MIDTPTINQLSSVISQATAPAFLLGALSELIAILIGRLNSLNLISNMTDLARRPWRSAISAAPGPAAPGLKVDGSVVAKEKMEHTIPLTLQWDEALDIVDDNDYSAPFTFTGSLKRVTLNIDRPKLSPADIQRLQEAARAAGDGPSASAGSGSAASVALQVSGNAGLGLMQKINLQMDKREGCRKQAAAKGLGTLERIQLVRMCMQ